MAGCDWQPRFIVGISTVIIGQILVDVFFIRLEKVLCILFPCAKMIFVEDDKMDLDELKQLIKTIESKRK